MIAIYVTSSVSGAGKTAICAGLGRYLLSSGKRVGFFKPVGSGGDAKDGDAAFMKRLLAQEESQNTIAPIATNAQGIKEAFGRASAGKDVVLVEGDQSQASLDVAAALNARVILVVDYTEELPKAIESGKRFGTRLLGIAVNKVPRSRLERMRGEVSHLTKEAGLRVIGTLPEDRSLLTLTVGEVAGLLHGEIMTGAGRSSDLIENVMLGALTVDPGPVYFARKVNKAVVVRSERPDLQLAALHTPTTCLIVTGNSGIRPIVLQRAAREDVAVVSVLDNASSVATQIDEALPGAKFSHEKKLPRLDMLMQQNFDFSAAVHELGLGS
ncbi:MAG: phosphotransacetylase family protein [Chloroflexi bacterium]|nr:phosphotransacetylase family protein [Chloroflexota bacterium]